MPSLADEAFEWLDRAEQAREAAGQLTIQGPNKPSYSSLPTSSGSRGLPPIQSFSAGGNWRGTARHGTRKVSRPLPLKSHVRLPVQRREGDLCMLCCLAPERNTQGSSKDVGGIQRQMDVAIIVAVSTACGNQSKPRPLPIR